MKKSTRSRIEASRETQETDFLRPNSPVYWREHKDSRRSVCTKRCVYLEEFHETSAHRAESLDRPIAATRELVKPS
jgi:hypothetical protein